MALIWPAMLALVLATVQVALLYLAGQLALTAAQDGLRAGRYHPAASTARARQVSEDFLARTAGTTLESPTVTAALSGDGAVLQVDVTGTVRPCSPASSCGWPNAPPAPSNAPHHDHLTDHRPRPRTPATTTRRPGPVPPRGRR